MKALHEDIGARVLIEYIPRGGAISLLMQMGLHLPGGKITGGMINEELRYTLL